MDRSAGPEAAEAWGGLSLLLTDDSGIRQINRRHLARDAETDVLCFRYGPLPGEGHRSTGEIVLNVERALREGRRRAGWSASRELALYLAHGCDHLAGADDATPAARARMRRRELRWLGADTECAVLTDLLIGTGEA